MTFMEKGIAKAVLGAALLIGGTVAADPVSDLYVDGAISHPQHATGSWVDFGLMYGHIEPVAGTLLSTEFVRFGPRASLNRFLYVGAEVDIGRITGVDQADSNTVARDGSSTSTMSEDPAASTTGGTLAAAKAVIGAHVMTGPLSGAAELALGVRDYMLEDAIGQFGQAYFGGVYEVHGRLDLWATRSLTVGALASLDLADRNDVSLGVVVGFHFIPYDGQRRY
jgi:hypothetical protein